MIKTIVNKKLRKTKKDNHPLNRKFDTAEEGAQDKVDYVMHTVLKDFDWNAFMAKKENQASQK
ncbi:hypothetical protein GCM10027423_16860 [Spirosoma arcticum]